MKYLITTITAFMIFNGALAQSYKISDYQWGQPVYEEREINDTSRYAYLLHRIKYQYLFQDEQFLQDKLFHRKVYLNSPKGIEDYNKVYIPQGGSNQLLKFEARAIKGDKVREVDEDDILTGTWEESGQEYTYFAIEGLEVGTVVEYYYVLRRPANYRGINVEYQYDLPVERFELDIISPEHLVFDAKVYNLNDSIQSDTTYGDLNWLYVRADSVPAFESEVMATSDDLYGRVVFKLDRNLYNGKNNLVAYNSFAQNVVDFLNRDISRRDEKALNKLSKKIAKADGLENYSPAEKIDSYLKENFRYLESSSEELDELDEMIDAGAYAGIGGMLLYTRLLEMNDVSYEVVYTTNRANLKFDPEFETFNYLEESLIYIPDQDIYLDYSDPGSCNGVINHMLTGNEALFISETAFNDEIVAITDIREIEYKDADFTIDSMRVEVSFGPNLAENTLDVRRSMGGFVARNFQGIYDLIPKEEDYHDFVEVMVATIDEDAKVENLEVKNAGSRYQGKKPLVLEATLEEGNFMQNAGNDYLFNLGKLIGPQVEMYYEDTVRDYDVETAYAKKYERFLTFTVPEGYELADPGVMELKEVLKIDGKERARFESTYDKNGRTYTVSVFEYYEDLTYPKEKFTEYVEVINAAADFNKVSLLFKKI